MGFAEVNVCWHKLTPRNRLHECTIGWFESLHLLVVYNRREMNPPCHMFGGTAILSINKVVGHVMGSNRDPTGLGRWNWTKYRGHQGIVFWFACGYWPCLPTGDDKALSVYAQHQKYFDDEKDNVCPREAFTRHLKKAIE
jgi:hypothetical protein